MEKDLGVTFIGTLVEEVILKKEKFLIHDFFFEDEASPRRQSEIAKDFDILVNKIKAKYERPEEGVFVIVDALKFELIYPKL